MEIKLISLQCSTKGKSRHFGLIYSISQTSYYLNLVYWRRSVKSQRSVCLHCNVYIVLHLLITNVLSNISNNIYITLASKWLKALLLLERLTTKPSTWGVKRKKNTKQIKSPLADSTSPLYRISCPLLLPSFSLQIPVMGRETEWHSVLIYTQAVWMQEPSKVLCTPILPETPR